MGRGWYTPSPLQARRCDMDMAGELISRINSSDAEQRAVGYAAIDELVVQAGGTCTTPEEAVATAVACAEALLATIARPAVHVPPAEYRRAAVALESLHLLDHFAVASACIEGGRIGALWQPGNAFCTVLEVPLDEVSREDILTLGHAWSVATTFMNLRGLPPGVTFNADCIPLYEACPLLAFHPMWQSDDEGARIEQLSELTLALVHDPEAAPDDVRAGLEVATILSMARPATAAALLTGGLLDAAVSLAKRSSPMDWAAATSAAGRRLVPMAQVVGQVSQVR